MSFSIFYNITLKDKFSNVTKKVNKASRKMKQHISSLSSNIGKSTRKMKLSFSSLSSSINKSAKAINKNIKKIGFGARRLGTKFIDAGKNLSLKLSLPIVALGGFMIKAASDAEEAGSKFNTVFKSIQGEANSVSKNLSRNFGLSRVAATELLGDTGDLLTGFGFTQKSALNLSKQVNELAVDLASFTNFSGGAKGASQALTKALLGERESIKSLGISILEEDVKARVKFLVVSKKMRFATMRQAKAFATLQLAQEQSKNAIGDFARTQEGFANRMRTFKARLGDLGVSFGKILLPPALKLLNIIVSLSEKFLDLSPATKKIILIIGGLVAILGPLIIGIGIAVKLAGLLAIGFAFITGPIGLIILGVAALATGIFFLIKNWKTLLSWFKGTVVFKIIAFQIRMIGNVIDFVISKIRLFFSIANKVIAFLKPLDDFVASAFGSVGDFFGGESGSVMAKSENKNTFDGNLQIGINDKGNNVQSVKMSQVGDMSLGFSGVGGKF